ncbi:OLC1v1024009C1 [Oldenlandia corymbosa var. corymbosa]|uniref:OLC1v1024009C1 n=1 Tax=Oldenlandia corymbosa var. corymbosa TaxID=529605 RepID=A0AAV1C228_OLDCO|nr:OLC1v1024009C1 [Oldenlandia corymbosa var. corymbosa]
MSDYFPEEVVIEILSRVPAKSLVRFLLVSKTWYSLINSPDFIATHLNNVRLGKTPNSSSLSLVRQSNLFSLKEHYVLYSDGGEEGGVHGRRNLIYFGRIYFPVKSEDEIFRMVGICDGLVYISDRSNREENYLWNPSVRKYVKLPPPTNPPPNFSTASGFGADSHGDYKVVRVVYCEGYDGEGFCLTLPPEVEVYS